MSKYEIRAYRPGDEAAILATFARAFGESLPPGTRPRTMADWQWTYAANPAGMRVWVAMDGDVAAAHYASQPNRARVDGEVRVFAQIVDSMVHPDYRRGLRRPGLFIETAQKMLAETCGPSPDKDLVTYGWPTQTAWRAGMGYLDYEMVRRESVLTRPPGEGPETFPEGVTACTAFDERVRGLYERCASEWKASTIRDETYLNWRVFAHPDRPYRALLRTRRGDELLGYAVARASDWPMPGCTVLCDWLVPPADVMTGELLLEGVLADARAAGRTQLLALFPQWSPWFLFFQDRGFLVTATDYFMSGRNNHPRHDMFWLRDFWWYQPIDLDLV